MPEGPEILRMVDELYSVIDTELLSFEIVSGRYSRNALDKIDEFRSLLPLRLTGIGVKGKFIWFEFDEVTLWSTCGMTGKWSLQDEKHTHLHLQFSEWMVYYADQRNFGTLKISFDPEELEKKLRSIGPDMLAYGTSFEEMDEAYQAKGHQTLPALMMNQKLVSGIGNYLKAEALYRARLSPFRCYHELSDEERKRLFDVIRKIMQDSYQTRHTSSEDAFQLLVYRQNADPRGYRVINDQTDDKRTTWWVPEIQH